MTRQALNLLLWCFVFFFFFFCFGLKQAICSVPWYHVAFYQCISQMFSNQNKNYTCDSWNWAIICRIEKSLLHLQMVMPLTELVEWVIQRKEANTSILETTHLTLVGGGDRKGGAGNNRSISISKLKSVKLVLTLEARWSWNYFSLSLFPLIGHHVLNLHNTIIMLLEGNFNELFPPKLHSILIEVIKVAK